MPHIQGKGHCISCPIRHLSIFAQLPEERLQAPELQAFQPAVMTFTKSETVYHQEMPAEAVYTLRKGLVKLTKTLANGRTQITRILRRGELFGFDGLAEAHYNHTAIPLTPIEVCRLPLAELRSLKNNHSEIDNAMMVRWIQYLREAEDMMLELGAKKANERLASFLIRWCNADNEMEGDWSALPLSRAEIGELLGLTLETVSRILSDWKRNQLIDETRNSLQILNKEKLQLIADPEDG